MKLLMIAGLTALALVVAATNVPRSHPSSVSHTSVAGMPTVQEQDKLPVDSSRETTAAASERVQMNGSGNSSRVEQLDASDGLSACAAPSRAVFQKLMKIGLIPARSPTSPGN